MRRERKTPAAITRATGQSFEREYLRIMMILRNADPELLMSMGAHDDEYAPEAKDLALRVIGGEIVDAQVIQDVWFNWFGYGTLCSYVMDERRAAIIAGLINSGSSL